MRRAGSRWRRTSRRRSASPRAPPQGLPDGEYRVHLLFRAIPPATPVVQAAGRSAEGRALPADPGLRRDHPGDRPPRQPRRQRPESPTSTSTTKDGKPVVALDLSRTGDRSTFGEVRVFKAGVKDPDRDPEGGRGLHRSRQPPGRGPGRRGASRAQLAARSPSNMSKPSTTAAHVLAETQAVLR